MNWRVAIAIAYGWTFGALTAQHDPGLWTLPIALALGLLFGAAAGLDDQRRRRRSSST